MTTDFPDISYYQGVVDWAKMRSKTTNIIIRSQHGPTPDAMFKDNWVKAKHAGLLRGVYAFYEDTTAPRTQANLLVSLVKDSPPETRIWVDWERSYNGQYQGIASVVAMMKEIERLMPDATVGIYTGYYWFKEHTNPVTNKAEFEYLKGHPLWIADYDSAPTIPLPWSWPPELHQYGTPSIGYDYGVRSIEIDMNRILDNHHVYNQTPPSQGDKMIGKVLVTLNIRKTPDATQSPIGLLQVGDVVEANTEVNGWWSLTKIVRGGMGILLPATPCYAYEGSTNQYIQEITQPAEDVPPQSVTVVDENGVSWKSTSFTKVT